MPVKLSRTSKLGTYSWSLQAIETCPGSVAPGGGLVEACRGCYATQGTYRFPNVKEPRAFNKEDWKRDAWVSDMIAVLRKQTHFRWFDSGDCYNIALARKILAVVRGTPNVKHWLPTRMGKFPKFAAVLALIDAEPNAVVRHSGDDVLTKSYRHSTPKGAYSVILASPAVPAKGTTLCEAYSRGGKCGDCRACYDKTVACIAYPAHGVSMKKVIRLKLAA